MVTGREWELNRRHHGNGIGNGNELMGMVGNDNVATHSRTSLVTTRCDAIRYDMEYLAFAETSRDGRPDPYRAETPAGRNAEKK